VRERIINEHQPKLSSNSSDKLTGGFRIGQKRECAQVLISPTEILCKLPDCGHLILFTQIKKNPPTYNISGAPFRRDQYSAVIGKTIIKTAAEINDGEPFNIKCPQCSKEEAKAITLVISSCSKTH
jgi:hypothetical protein